MAGRLPVSIVILAWNAWEETQACLESLRPTLGLRDQVIVMVGGAPVTQEYADAVGADGYASDASAAVKQAKELLHRRRSLVPA